MAGLALERDQIRCLVPFGNILAITGGVRSGQKVPNGKQREPCKADPTQPEHHHHPPTCASQSHRRKRLGGGIRKGIRGGIQGEFALGFGEFAPAAACESPLAAVRGLLMSCTESSFYNIRSAKRHLQASNGATRTRTCSSARLLFDAF